MGRPDGRSRSRRGPGWGWFAAGYLGVAGFFALEASVRRPGEASSLDATEDDQGTTATIVGAYAVAGIASPVLRRLPLRRLPGAVGPIGLALQGTGLGLRAWSMRTLGTAYTRTLRSELEHRVVDEGPYALVRHPGYLGSLMIWTGFALTSGSLPVAATVGGMLGQAYRRRIAVEEELLCRDLPGYEAYARRTWRLVPFVW